MTRGRCNFATREPPTDVVVVGGGPAGLMTGITLAEQGLHVQVFEQRALPVDKACGEGWMPSGWSLLAASGIEAHLSEREGHPLVGVRYVRAGGSVAEASFREGPGVGLRRTALSQALAARASTLSRLRLQRGVRVVGLDREGVRPRVRTAEGAGIEARLVVGADGLHSRVRRWAGLAAPARGPARWGARRHFGLKPWTDHVEVHWGRGAEAYVTPVGLAEIGVAILWSPAQVAAGGGDLFGHLLGQFPALAARLHGAPALSDTRAVGPLEQRTHAPACEGVALVGDASGYVDAMTGEGLSLAVAEAEALAACVAPVLSTGGTTDALTAALARYARRHRDITCGYERMTRLLLGLAQRPEILAHALEALAQRPAAFQLMMSMNMGTRSPTSLIEHPRDIGQWLQLAAAMADTAAHAALTHPARRLHH